MTRSEYLKSEIDEAQLSYLRTGASKYTDAEFDALVREGERLTGEKHEVITDPAVISSGKVKHPADRPMLSMEKVYSFSDLMAWWNKYGLCNLVCMPKYDGIALVKYYSGVVATAGKDGLTGEDVTGITMPFMRDAVPGRGEAIIRKSAFEKSGLSARYQSPRSAVAGILNAKTPELAELAKYIEFARYSSITVGFGHGGHVTMTETLVKLARREILNRSADFPTDGIVYRIADESKFLAAGKTAHHWRGQVALKGDF